MHTHPKKRPHSGAGARTGHDIEDFNDVFVLAKVAEEFDLAKDALGVDEVQEDFGDTLDRNFAARNLPRELIREHR